MSSGLDSTFVREHYAGMSDSELKRILVEDGLGLTAEGKKIALDEAKRRGFSEHLVQGIDTQNRVLSNSEIEELCSLVQNLPCPICGNSAEALNATLVSRVISMLVITHREQKVILACPSCLDASMRKATIATAILGWWGIPWGLIRTPEALGRNFKFLKSHHLHFPNDVLKDFVASNAAKISVLRNDKDSLRRALPQ